MVWKRQQAYPSFGAEVLVKRWFWGRQDLQATHEKVRYLAPDPEGMDVWYYCGPEEMQSSCPTSSGRLGIQRRRILGLRC